MQYIERDLQDEFLAYSREFPIVLLTGMRQCGKSTMLEHLAKGSREIVTLDDLQQRALAQEDPQLFFQLHEPPLIVDEVQYAPQLFPYLKIYADSHPDDMGAIWLTGSQPYSLMKLAGESLAGRVGILHMLPLSQHELYGTGSALPLEFTIPSLHKRIESQEAALLPQVYERIFRGWMPAVANGRNKPARFYQSYVQTYVERDVRDMDKGADAVSFMRFMGAVAAQVGQLLNIESLAHDADISRAKAQEWLGILERSSLIFLLQPYSNNALKRAVKTRKLYFTDTGLAAWLGRWSSSEALEAGALSGPIFENYVVAEVMKTIRNTGDNALVWFYRDRDMKEIDMLLERDAILHPIEVKKSANPQRKDIRAFSTLHAGSLRVGMGMLVCMKQDLSALNDECFIVPAWAL